MSYVQSISGSSNFNSKVIFIPIIIGTGKMRTGSQISLTWCLIVSDMFAPGINTGKLSCAPNIIILFPTATYLYLQRTLSVLGIYYIIGFILIMIYVVYSSNSLRTFELIIFRISVIYALPGMHHSCVATKHFSNISILQEKFIKLVEVVYVVFMS